MPQLCRFQVGADRPRLGLLDGSTVRDLSASGLPPLEDLDAALAIPREELRRAVEHATRGALPSVDLTADQVRLLAPLQSQEVWAAGVTYLRSRDARVEESTEKSVYERVYEAERPEIFFKATLARCVGPEESIRIRADSRWDVPEAELTLVLNRRLELVGVTAGNDVSSRSIEGENPLYLPQAKIWYQSCALGPAITPFWERSLAQPFRIQVAIWRGGQRVFAGETSTSSMARSFKQLIDYMGRDNCFPHGALLMTGTGVVPPAELTLEHGDVVEITVEDVGTLRNPVIRGTGSYVLAD